MAVSIGLAMMRVMTGISIFWLVVPGYLAAIVMSFFVPKIFTAIAFDSGGVASGYDGHLPAALCSGRCEPWAAMW